MRYSDLRKRKKIPNKRAVCKRNRMTDISTPGPVKWIPCTWMDPSETYLIASCAKTVVKGTLMESERGCCLIQMFRYPSNTHFTMGDLDASLKFVINIAISSVFDIPGKYVFLIDLGDNLQTPHCQNVNGVLYIHIYGQL